MQYGEKRVQIATMRDEDQEKAVALVVRLQDWCSRFDEALVKMAEGQGAARKSGGDFDPQNYIYGECLFNKPPRRLSSLAARFAQHNMSAIQDGTCSKKPHAPPPSYLP